MLPHRQDEHVSELRIHNKMEVCEMFRITLATLDAWIRAGCPYIQRGTTGVKWKFDVFAVYHWKYVENASGVSGDDPEQMPPKERLDYYRSERERLKLEQDRGELLLATEVEKQWTDEIMLIKSRLLATPQRIASDLVGLNQSRDIELALTDHIRGLLSEMSERQAETPDDPVYIPDDNVKDAELSEIEDISEHIPDHTESEQQENKVKKLKKVEDTQTYSLFDE